MARERIGALPDDEEWGEERGPFSFLSRLKDWPVTDLVALTLCVVAAGAVAINALFLQTGPHPAPIFAIAAPESIAVEPSAPPAVVARTPESTGAVNVRLPRPRPSEIASAKSAELPRADEPGQRSRGELIAGIQRELAQRGFYDGPPDGFYGPKTDAAIRDFEQAARIRPSAEPTEALLAAIVRSNVMARPTPPAVIPVAARPDPLAELIAPPPKRIQAVQRALSEWGYGQLRTTGTLDAETVAAIEKFERDRKLPLTGRPSERVLRELAVVTGRPLE